MTELILDSLQRRMATMHSLYYQAVDSMDLSHVNHFEREGVLPIAFSLFHYTNMQDSTFMVLSGGEPPIWNAEWQARVQMAIDDHGKERTVEEMVDQRIGDYEAFKEYQRAVFDRHRAVADNTEPARPWTGAHPPPLPQGRREHLQRPVRGPGGHHAARRHRVSALPARPASHGRDRGCQARGLVGLGGMTS